MGEHKHDLAIEVQEAIDAWKQGPIGDEGRFTWAARSAEELAEAVHAAAIGVEGDRSQLKAQATVLALRIFDETIVPYDVPGIGAITEGWIESAVRGAIPSLVSSMFDQLDQLKQAT